MQHCISADMAIARKALDGLTHNLTQNSKNTDGISGGKRAANDTFLNRTVLERA